MAEESVNTTQLQDWVARIQAGDESARDELLKRLASRLERLARKMLKRFPKIQQWTEVDDILQNAMLRLIRALEEVQINSRREFYGLAATQMRRELLDLVRHFDGPMGPAKNLVGQGSEDQVVPEPEAPQESDEDLEIWRRFHEEVEKLPVVEREVVGLIYYHGWTRERVSEVLCFSERTVRRHWKRALEKLRGSLREES